MSSACTRTVPLASLLPAAAPVRFQPMVTAALHLRIRPSHQRVTGGLTVTSVVVWNVSLAVESQAVASDQYLLRVSAGINEVYKASFCQSLSRISRISQNVQTELEVSFRAAPIVWYLPLPEGPMVMAPLGGELSAYADSARTAVDSKRNNICALK
jgi:hypothetical protein